MSSDLTSMISEICAYCFDSSTKFYVNMSVMRRGLCSQLSYCVRETRKKAKTKHTTAITVLVKPNSFVFCLQSTEPFHRIDEYYQLSLSHIRVLVHPIAFC